uniref:Cleavage stimulation factor subunit 77 n=1 Tax=Hirondellea gigas TaxID=1518452 RepID=A0A6A7G8I8_9CRUS
MDYGEIVKRDKYNTEAWTTLLNNVNTIEEARPLFERFFKIFPTAARYWKIWIEKEMSAKNLDRVEKIFDQCLFSNLDVDLWRSYINYIKLVKKGASDELQGINTAYEFVLKHVGIDLNATSIWNDHINFLKTELKGIATNEKIAAIRGVYHHAIITPMAGVDQIWREYDSWEHSNDKNLAKGILTSFNQQHQTAKMCSRQRKRLRRSIMSGMLARPPRGNSQVRDRDYLQVIHWSKLIDYEKSNPQRLTPTQLEERVVFTYKQSLQTLRHYPEMWNSYAEYVCERHQIGDAIAIYEKAITAIPDSILMNFFYAEFLESHKKIEEARTVYEKLISLNDDPLIFIQFLRFSRRCEGMAKARKLFIAARKSKKCSYHIYIAAAMLEYFQNDEPKVALKILKLGLPLFIQNSQFVLHYLDFLTHRNDVNNLRAVFERVLKEMDPKNSGPIWERYIEFEQRFGDLKALKEAERRLCTAMEYPEIKKRMCLYKRYGYLGLLPCSQAHYNTLERVLTTRIPDVHIESNSKSNAESSHSASLMAKRYTAASDVNFFRPDSTLMVEYKPGNPFLLPGQPVVTPDGADWPIPELPDPLDRLLRALPPSQITQGIPITADHLCTMISGSTIPEAVEDGKPSALGDFQELFTGEKRKSGVADEAPFRSDLYNQRRKAQKLS